MFSLCIYYVQYIIIVPNLRDFHFQTLLSPEKTVYLHRCTARAGRQGYCLRLTRVNQGPQGCVTPVTSERERAGTSTLVLPNALWGSRRSTGCLLSPPPLPKATISTENELPSSWIWFWFKKELKKYLYTHAQSSTAHNNQNSGNNPSVHQWMHEWTNKTWSVHTMEYYSAFERKAILPHVTIRMNLGDVILSEISQ